MLFTNPKVFRIRPKPHITRLLRLPMEWFPNIFVSDVYHFPPSGDQWFMRLEDLFLLKYAWFREARLRGGTVRKPGQVREPEFDIETRIIPETKTRFKPELGPENLSRSLNQTMATKQRLNLETKTRSGSLGWSRDRGSVWKPWFGSETCARSHEGSSLAIGAWWHPSYHPEASICAAPLEWPWLTTQA